VTRDAGRVFLVSRFTKKRGAGQRKRKETATLSQSSKNNPERETEKQREAEARGYEPRRRTSGRGTERVSDNA